MTITLDRKLFVYLLKFAIHFGQSNYLPGTNSQKTLEKVANFSIDQRINHFFPAVFTVLLSVCRSSDQSFHCFAFKAVL